MMYEIIVSRSPVFSHFGETLNGLTTIKAYKAEGIFTEMIAQRIDRNIQFYHSVFLCNR